MNNARFVWLTLRCYCIMLVTGLLWIGLCIGVVHLFMRYYFAEGAGDIAMTVNGTIAMAVMGFFLHRLHRVGLSDELELRTEEHLMEKMTGVLEKMGLQDRLAVLYCRGKALRFNLAILDKPIGKDVLLAGVDLLERIDESEIEAMICHEIGHQNYPEIRIYQLARYLWIVAELFLTPCTIHFLWLRLVHGHFLSGLGLVALGILLWIAAQYAGLILRNVYLQSAEYLADARAVRNIGSYQPLLDGITTIHKLADEYCSSHGGKLAKQRQRLLKIQGSPWGVFLLDHPSNAQRESSMRWVLGLGPVLEPTDP